MSDAWSITDHACRVCMGRVLIRKTKTGTVARCADCGIEAPGSAKSICACGKKQRDGRDAGLRCAANKDQRPEAPQEIVVISIK